MLHIKADEDLFNEWKMLGHRVLNQSAVVQNDMEVELDEVKEWVKMNEELIKSHQQLIRRTLKYIRECNNAERH